MQYVRCSTNLKEKAMEDLDFELDPELRDVFAALAMLGYIAYGEQSEYSVPKWAYQMADAMLEYRNATDK